MIDLRQLSKIYRTDRVETAALTNINLKVAAGEFVTIMGSSGCGKSTLLNIIGLLDAPAAGEYHFNGKALHGLSEKEKTAFRTANIGFIFQSFNLIDRLTVTENIALPLYYAGVDAAERKERVAKILAQLNLSHRAAHHPKQLSGGQQQRVAIARALIGKPRLILADEPTGNLDSANGNGVMEMLCDLNDAGTTVIMVTHSQHDAGFSKRIIYMKDGQIVTEKFNRNVSAALV
ncbi:ABC transporter ATP-binding protein [Deminuibacter soli]|uniref:ABC transporter ATP-binding protein n=1 Tax=Deminuibacter soli TaxID=2291815 RepID=A0A3E1NJC5_9BACT|nr:ABC transporter ATP-binding protein [Deminuibacter soli]RFM28037.1 ABC transporter ATP-binding protein [Deminuibacter soli]